MKFYVIEIAKGDKSIEGKGIYEYDTRVKALASFHKKLGIAMDSNLYTSYSLIAVDSKNTVYASDWFDHTEGDEMAVAE